MKEFSEDSIENYEEYRGIQQKENPVHLSNLSLVCPNCKKTTRVSKRVLESGEKVRVCQQCDVALDK